MKCIDFEHVCACRYLCLVIASSGLYMYYIIIIIIVCYDTVCITEEMAY